MAHARNNQSRGAGRADHGAGDRQRRRHAREFERRMGAHAQRKARIKPQKGQDIG